VTMPLPSVVAGGAADITGTLAAVHFRDERGFAIFSTRLDSLASPPGVNQLARVDLVSFLTRMVR
jgi:hypothetical protein